MAEKVDIFNDRYELVGTADKKEAHRHSGQWHRSFICLLVNPEKKTVLLQSKVKNLYDFDRPDYVDFTVGGHYQAGESIEDGLRELKEEIGINADFNDLVQLGVRQTAHTITDSFIEYEFQHLFLYPTTRKLDDFALDVSEVKGLIEINIQDGIDLLLEKVEAIPATSATLVHDEMIRKDFKLTRKEFVPSYLIKDKIFVRLFIAAKRFVRGDTIEEIFV